MTTALETAADTAPTGPLLDEFATPPYEEWREMVESWLKGVPFEKRLVTRTYEGIALQPIYQAKDIADLPLADSLPGQAPYLRGTHAAGYLANGWDVSQEIGTASPDAFNADVLHEIERGLTAINMVVDDATRRGDDPDWGAAGDVGAGGLSVAHLGDLRQALQGVPLEDISLFARTGASGMPFTALLVALARARNLPTEQLHGCIEMDPLGVLAHAGTMPQSLEGAYREMSAATRWAAANAPRLQTICVHARSWHEGGGTAVQELAYALGASAEYLRAMDARGIPVSDTARHTRWAMNLGNDFFMAIAKLRAARLLWDRLVEAAGGDDASRRLALHARTDRYGKTTYDPYVNMLRTTAEAFAAVLGGCDSLQVGTFDEVLGKPTEFSRRIARNTQLILRDECDLGRVVDPAGGSYYLEALTAELAEKAWEEFREVERRGGLFRAMEEGYPQLAVAKVAASRLEHVAQRRSSVIGVNKYANATEKPPKASEAEAESLRSRRSNEVSAFRLGLSAEQDLEVVGTLARIIGAPEDELFERTVAAAAAGASLGEITRAVRIKDGSPPRVNPVCLHRGAYQFEYIRSKVAEWGQSHGGAPKVFFANMGPVRQHKLRADFCRGFFETVGFEVVSPNGFASGEEAAKAAVASGAPAVIICSTDDTYPELVPAVAKPLKEAKPDVVLTLAGHPGDHESAYREAGVDEFVHIKANALQLLTGILIKIGVFDDGITRLFHD